MQRNMHSSLERGQLKIVSPAIALLDVQDEVLDSSDGAVVLGVCHVVLQQKEKLVVELLILADLLTHLRAILSQERNN